MELKVYVAGKVSKESVFGTHDWRDPFCVELSKLIGIPIKNLDPTKNSPGFDLNQSNAILIYGRNAYMISISDVVIVNLTNDISVGGSQEMLLAKYFKKPLIGIAPRGGKFVRAEKELMGKIYLDWTDPIVNYTCDAVVEDLVGAAKFINEDLLTGKYKTKSLDIINKSIEIYKANYYERDSFLH